MAAAPKTFASQINAANKTAVELVRLRDGTRVKLPGGTWAALDDGRKGMGSAANWVRDDKVQFERFTETPGPAWKGIDLSRPIGTRTPTGGTSGPCTVVLLAAIPPGTQCLVQTGQWQRDKKRSGYTTMEFANAERFVTAGVRPGADTRNWLNQEPLGFWERECDRRREVLAPTYQLSPYTIGVATKAPKHRDTVLAVVGIPKPGSKDTILELPGDATCVPVGYAVMRELGYPAQLQPLDTPGFVRLSTDAGAVVGTVWLVGDVGLDQPRMEPLPPEGKMFRRSPRENHRMPCPRTNPLYTPGGEEFTECYKQGIAAYVPGFDGREDLDGPVVLLMPGAKGLDWAKTTDLRAHPLRTYGRKIGIDEPGYWLDSPVVW